MFKPLAAAVAISGVVALAAGPAQALSLGSPFCGVETAVAPSASSSRAPLRPVVFQPRPRTEATLICEGEDVEVSCADVETLDDANLRLSEESEDLEIVLDRDDGPFVPIDLTSLPPEPDVMAQCIRDMYEFENEVGYAFAIAQSGGGESADGVGFARQLFELRNPGVPMTKDKQMIIASVSKILTAVATMKLLEEHSEISLDTPFFPLVEDRFPDRLFLSDGTLLVIPGRLITTVTIRDLLMHRSGFVNFGPSGCRKLSRILGIGQLFFIHDVEVPFDYNNANFCMLGIIIEAVSGEDYESYVQDHVLTPMGITHMSCEQIDTAPTLYYNTQLNSFGVPLSVSPEACPAGGWFASAAQLLDVLVNIREDTVLSLQSREEMRNMSCDTAYNGPAEYCLGWFRKTDGSSRRHHWHHGRHHNGSKGVQSVAMSFELGVDAVLLVNTRGIPQDSLDPGERKLTLRDARSILRACFAEAFFDANEPVGR